MYSIMRNQYQTQPKKIETFSVQKYEAKGCVQKMSYMIIRPSRFRYNEALVQPRKGYKGKYHHEIFYISFALSLYLPEKTKYVMLYLHGNSSSRYQGYNHLRYLPPDVGLACFDFDGCGNRFQSQFISLGKRQSDDVDKAVTFLKQKGLKVAVWGRSMGSVCALLSKEADVIIADSPFCSLTRLCKELAQTQVPCACLCCFHCLFPCFFWLIGKDIESKTQMCPSQMQISQLIQRIDKPRHILFMAAKQDKMISYVHSQILFQKCPSKNKKIILFNGTHNSDRPTEVLQKAFQFTEEALFQDNNCQRSEIDATKIYVEEPASLMSFSDRLSEPIKIKQVESKKSLQFELSEIKTQNHPKKSSIFHKNQIRNLQV